MQAVHLGFSVDPYETQNPLKCNDVLQLVQLSQGKMRPGHGSLRIWNVR